MVRELSWDCLGIVLGLSCGDSSCRLSWIRPTKNGYRIRVWFRCMSWTNNWLHYVYILRCADDRFYTGMTWNVERRVSAHNGVYLPPPIERPVEWKPPPPKASGNAKRGHSWTSHRRPVVLMFSCEVCCKGCTRSTEIQIKKLSRQSKLDLIENPSSFVPQRCERFPTLQRIGEGVGGESIPDSWTFLAPPYN